MLTNILLAVMGIQLGFIAMQLAVMVHSLQDTLTREEPDA